MSSGPPDPGLYAEMADWLLDSEDAGAPARVEDMLERWPGHEATAQAVLTAVGQAQGRRVAPGPAQVPELAPGTRLGDYVVDRLHARGGWGGVYLAHQPALGDRRVALKVVTFRGHDGAADPVVVRRFEREVAAAAKLGHPHLAAVYGSGEQGALHWYAMRFVEGPSLRKVLAWLAEHKDQARDPAIRRRVVERVAEVAEALAAVHAHGLVHRDVKPANIVIEAGDNGAAGGRSEETGEAVLAGSTFAEPFPDGPAVLVDFGLVRPSGLSELTLTDRLSGTPDYAAPEAFQREEIGAAADVFGLGVTLHDLLTARLPDERREPGLVPRPADLPPLRSVMPDVDGNLAAVVDRCTALAPGQRYADARALAADLRAWLAGEPVSARPLPRSERLLRVVRRHPLRAFAAAWGLLLVLGMLAASAAFVSSAWETAAELLRAREEGDLLGLRAALGAPGASWAMGDDDRAFARRLGVAEDVLSQAVTALEQADDERAVDTAIVDLARRTDHEQGPSALAGEPLLAAWLERLVREPAPVRRHAVRMLARFFTEERDLTPEAWAASAGLREALLQLIVDGAVAAPGGAGSAAAGAGPSGSGSAGAGESIAWGVALRGDQEGSRVRRDALTALAGCGDVLQVPPLLATMSDPSLDAELQRLMLYACWAIVLRAEAVGRHEVGPNAVELMQQVYDASWGGQGLRDEKRPISRASQSRINLLEALAVHSRRRGEELPPTLRDGLLAMEEGRVLLAGVVDPSTLPNLSDVDWRELEHPVAFARTSATRLVYAGRDDDPTIATWIAVLATLDDLFSSEGVTPLEAFVACLDEARGQMLGLLTGLLAHGRLDDSTLEPLELDWLRSPASDEDDAVWEFGSEGACRVSGCAAPPAVWGALRDGQRTVSSDSRASLWLTHPGGSVLALPFAVPQRRSLADVHLVLSGLCGARQQFADDGEALVDVWIDDQRVGLDLPMANSMWGELVLPLSNTIMTPGEHTLRIALGAGTTSPLWVDCVALKVR